MEKRSFQTFGQCFGVAGAALAMATPGRGDDCAAYIDDKEFGKVFGLAELVQQRMIVEMGEVAAKGRGQFGQVFPLLPSPVVQQFDSGFGNSLECLLNHRVGRPIESARPVHRQFSGLAKPR
ncbi:hypothetical protein [Pseudomonas veronii]|uniref:hypothetical protein n=1 Tax=Pseudomonas veronii TaxID=76761 RepID=UPI003F74BBF7